MAFALTMKIIEMMIFNFSGNLRGIDENICKELIKILFYMIVKETPKPPIKPETIFPDSLYDPKIGFKEALGGATRSVQEVTGYPAPSGP